MRMQRRLCRFDDRIDKSATIKASLETQRAAEKDEKNPMVRGRQIMILSFHVKSARKFLTLTHCWLLLCQPGNGKINLGIKSLYLYSWADCIGLELLSSVNAPWHGGLFAAVVTNVSDTRGEHDWRFFMSIMASLKSTRKDRQTASLLVLVGFWKRKNIGRLSCCETALRLCSAFLFLDPHLAHQSHPHLNW